MRRLTPAMGLALLGSLAGCSAAVLPAPAVSLTPIEPTTVDTLSVVFGFGPIGQGGAPTELVPFETHVRWSVDGQAQPEHDDSDTIPAGVTAKGQTWAVTVVNQADDGERLSATDRVTILNTRPVAQIALPAMPNADEDLKAVLTLSDADDDAVSVSYAWQVDGQATPWDGDTVPASAISHGQVWTVSVRPHDGEEDGETATATASIANEAPQVVSLVLTPSAPTEASVVTVTPSTDDAEGDPVTVSVAWRVNGVVVREATLNPGEVDSIDGSLFSKGDTVQASATPNDGFVDGAVLDSEVLTVVNTLPTVNSATVTPDPLLEGSTASCTAAGWHDEDGDAEAYRVAWTVSGVPVSASSLTGADFDKGDVLACILTPYDGEAEGTSVNSAPVTVQNTPPVLNSVALSSTTLTRNDTVSVILGSSVDDDGDAIAYAYDWTVNGSSVSSATTLGSGEFVRGDAIRVTVTPNDGTTDGVPQTSPTATVVNSVPTVSGVTLSPSDPVTDDVLTAGFLSQDGDADLLVFTYVWTVDGIVVGETGPSLDGDVYFDRGQRVVVSVTPDDGVDVGVAVSSAPVVVVNAPPTAPVVHVAPGFPSDADDLVCVVEQASTGADGDAVVYDVSWTRNGSSFGAASTTSQPNDTVLADETVNDDAWTCTVTPSDGLADGAAGEASVEVSDWHGPKVFTPCGASGAVGPSQLDCDVAYAGSNLEGAVVVSAGIQTWTVPITGTYRIEALGAQGGSGDPFFTGGRGARMRGDVSLTAGDELVMLVGQAGGSGGGVSSFGGGGGGGTFVGDGDMNRPLMIGGGGGGVRLSVSRDGCPGSISEYGGEGSGSGSGSGTSWACAAKTFGLGLGGDVSAQSWGSGGGGVFGDGASDLGKGGGMAATHGGVGGQGDDSAFDGGFGGGGSGHVTGGGGGGGYSGGEGGRVAGAGGSFNNGSSPVLEAGVREGHGEIRIELL